MLQLRFRSDGISVVLAATKEEVGILNTNTANTLMALVSLDESITFEPYLHWKESQDLKPQAKCFPANIIVYGNSGKISEVGTALSNAHLYLQEPPSFNHEYVYRNPHVLSWSAESTPKFLADSTENALDFSKEINFILNKSAPVDVPSDLTQSAQISTILLPCVLSSSNRRDNSQTNNIQSPIGSIAIHGDSRAQKL
jgi:hypothetical protein